MSKLLSARKSPTTSLLRAAELAWVLEQFGSIGIQCRNEGWCVGELVPDELVLSFRGLERVSVPGILRQRDREFRAARHRHAGHDAGCRALGVPRSVMKWLLREWGEPSSAGYLMESIEQAVLALGRADAERVWSAASATEELGAEIRSRITPTRPSDEVLSGWHAKTAAPRWVHAAFEMMFWWVSTRGLPRNSHPQVGSSSG